MLNVNYLFGSNWMAPEMWDERISILIMSTQFVNWNGLSRLTAARWSSIRPPCTRIMSEKKSSSGTVAPALFVLLLTQFRRLLFGGSPCSMSNVTFVRGNSDRCSSRREPWHRISMSRNASSGAGSLDEPLVFRCVGCCCCWFIRLRRVFWFCGDGTRPGNVGNWARCSSIRSDCKSAIISSRAFRFSFVDCGVDGTAGKLFCCTNGLRMGGSRLVVDCEWPITFNEHRWSSIRLLCVRVSISKKSSSGAFAIGATGIFALFSFVCASLLLCGFVMLRLPSGVNCTQLIEINF